MIIVQSVRELQVFLAQHAGETIGFVPTMGYLHAGHLSLVQQAKQENALVVVSIFVNPTQFGPTEDLATYPRDLEHDQQLLQSVHTDVLFFPTVAEVYPPDGSVPVFAADQALAQVACGAKRFGHFDGVVTVVARLFDIVQPTVAYFGLKDYQQYLIIKKMAADKKYALRIVGCPIVRESDGLALSSRNVYLSATERAEALVLSRALALAKQLVRQGLPLQAIHEAMTDAIKDIVSARIDYIEILQAQDLQPATEYIPGQIIVLLAVYMGKTRLIDNMIL